MSDSTPVLDYESAPKSAPRRQLTLVDTTSIIVGIIIGASIFESTWLIASGVPGLRWLMGAWVLGGVMSLIGAMCYAELGTAYPHEGGDYVYLTRAFGRQVGFLFAWAQIWVVRPGSVGAAAYVFARYANELWPQREGAGVLMAYAVGAVVVLTIVNIIGVQQGKWTQNVLTAAKLMGVAGIIVVGLVAGSAPGSAGAGKFEPSGFYLTMILIFYAYGGWNEMAYVAAEVRDPQRNILRSLVLGTVAVTAIYLLMNYAFYRAVGYTGMTGSHAIAADVLRLKLGDWAARVISILICITALGAMNGMIFTGSRIGYAMGASHRLYRFLGRWDPRVGTPVWSLVIQAMITAALAIGFGWTKAGFESMVKFTAPVFWIFFLLVGTSVFVLRVRDAGTPRPYRVPLYPVVPVLFCASSAFMLYASLAYAIENRSWEGAWAVGLLAVGFGLSFIDRAPPERT